MIKEFKSVIFDRDKSEYNKNLGIDNADDIIEEIVPCCVDISQVQGYCKTYIEFKEEDLEAVRLYMIGGNEIPVLGDFGEFDRMFREFKAK